MPAKQRPCSSTFKPFAHPLAGEYERVFACEQTDTIHMRKLEWDLSHAIPYKWINLFVRIGILCFSSVLLQNKLLPRLQITNANRHLQFMNMFFMIQSHYVTVHHCFSFSCIANSRWFVLSVHLWSPSKSTSNCFFEVN